MPLPRRCVHEWIDEQARQFPGRTAVVCDGRALSYRDLRLQSDSIAGRLVELGAGPEVLVGLCLDRSVEMIVGLLGILKAGAAYVPMDPNYPQERLAFLARDTRMPVLLTRPDFGLQSLAPQTLFIDDAVRESAREFALHRKGDLSSTAYVIYTSGSTGTPKGVVVTHRNLRHSTWARHSVYAEPVTNYLMVSSLAFDSSVAGIFWTLTQGGTLTLPRDGAHQDPLELARLIASERVSHLLCLPSLYSHILDAASGPQFESLRTVIVAGESCPAELVQRHGHKLPRTSLFNEYGPTEATVWATVFDCSRLPAGERVPIGRPIPNTTIQILDEHLRPVRPGDEGEICIGGDGVAWGYLRRPDLTAAKFFEDAPPSGTRWYRTGDRGRFRPDGNIEFLGRVDDQVKIRGHRIELGEIEAVLSNQSCVAQAAVTARGQAVNGSPPNHRIVAYVVLRDATMFLERDLRRALESKLPVYMIPDRIVALSQLPLLPNGKVDRKALPEPDWSCATEPASAPRTETEGRLVAIWQSVLRLPHVGVEDNFFDLGGHSLAAIQVMARIREAFRVELPLRALFDHPTVSSLAARLAACETADVRENGSQREEEHETARRSSRDPAWNTADGISGASASSRSS